MVQADGKPLNQRASAAEWEQDPGSWWHDAADGRLWIRLAGARNTRFTIED